jgi:peptidoglycan/LPS O-acetylase OafA/YrhL
MVAIDCVLSTPEQEIFERVAERVMSPQQPKDSSHSWRRLDGIDILRGLAILLVLMNHVNIRLRGARVPYTDGLPEQLVSSLVWNGQLGVQIFFAISGFLITSTTLRRWKSLSGIRVLDFYRLRFARIAPLLLLLLAVLSIFHFAQIKNFVVLPKTGGLSRALLAALTFRVNVLEAQKGYLPANWDILWSLSVEEVFYLFFPLACWLLARGKAFVGVLLLFVALGPFAQAVLAQGNEIWREYSYLGGMDAIALGCLTALVISATRFSRRTLWTLFSIGAVIVCFCLCFSLHINAWGLQRNGLDMTILAFGTCMIIAAAAQTQWQCPRLLTPLVRLGQFSYEVYLTHMFVVFMLFNVFLNTGKSLRTVPALFLGVIILAGVLGAAVARFYSEPVNRFIRKQSGNPANALGSIVENEPTITTR